MIDSEFVRYREVATVLEDEFYEFKAQGKDVGRCIEFLEHILSVSDNIYSRVCALSLLCQELATYDALHKDDGLAEPAKTAKRFDELLSIDYFDPLSLTSCSSYFLHDNVDILKSKKIALYATFVAEHARAFVRHAHQGVIRAAYVDQDWPTIESSLRRLSVYRPACDSPDPALEADVVEIAEKIDLDPAIKTAFFAAVSAQNKNSESPE
jgi:hypothetical protein